MKTIEDVLYKIKSKYYVRMDADEEEEEEPKKKKKPTGWGTRLPFGLCKSLGIDTTNMTPTEAWEAYENNTGKTASETYKEKAEKGEGKVIDVEEKSSGTLDYASMSQEELEEKAKEIQEEIDKVTADGAPVNGSGKKLEELHQEKDKIDSELAKKSAEEEPSGSLDYASMTKEELDQKYSEISKKVADIYEKYGGPHIGVSKSMSPEDIEAVDKLNGELWEISNKISDIEESSDIDIYELMSQEELESAYNDIAEQISYINAKYDMYDTMSDEDADKLTELYGKQQKIVEYLPEEYEELVYEHPVEELGKKPEDDMEPSEVYIPKTSGTEYASMPIDELYTHKNELTKQADDAWNKFMGSEGLSSEELNGLYHDFLDKNKEKHDCEKVIKEKGFQVSGYDKPTPIYSKEELEKAVGGNIEEFIDAGGIHPNSDGDLVSPFTGEIFDEDTATQLNNLADYYLTGAPEEPTTATEASGKTDYSSISVGELALMAKASVEEQDKKWNEFLETEDEVESDKAYKKYGELKKQYYEIKKALDSKGFKYSNGEASPIYTEEELEDSIGGTASELVDAGLITKDASGEYVNPLTGEVFTEGNAMMFNALAEHYAEKGVGIGTEPVEEPSHKVSAESLEEKVSGWKDNVDNLTKGLENIGFKPMEISDEDFDSVMEKYETLGKFYDAFKKKSKYDWETSLSDEEEKEYDKLSAEVDDSVKKLQDYGIYDVSYYDGDVVGYYKETVQNILENKEKASDYASLLKSAKKELADSEEKLVAFKAKETAKKDDPVDLDLEIAKSKIESQIKNSTSDMGYWSDCVKNDSGKTPEEIEALGGTEKLYEKELLAKKFYDAEQKIDDITGKYTGPFENFSKALSEGKVSKEEEDAYDNAQDEYWDAVNALNGVGIKDAEYGLPESLSKEAVTDALNKKGEIDYDLDCYNTSKQSLEEQKAQLDALETGGSKAKEEAPVVEEPPVETKAKKPSITTKKLEKNIADADEKIEKLKSESFTTEGSSVYHSYNDFLTIAESGAVTGVHSVEDIFTRAETVDKYYKAWDKYDKALKDYQKDHKGKTPSESYLMGEITAEEYGKAGKELQNLKDAVGEAATELKNGYGMVAKDGLIDKVTRDMVGQQLAWKDKVMEADKQYKELSAQRKEWSDQLESRQKKAQIKVLNAEKKELQKKADDAKKELDSLENKTYSGIWKHDVTTADYEGLNIQGKKDYYNEQLANLTGETPEEQAKIEKFNGYLEQLKELEAEGPIYAEKKKAYDQARAEVQAKQNEINVLKGGKNSSENFGPDSYTPERKNKALWAKTKKTADNALWGKSSEVWKGATEDEKAAIYDYTGSYSKFNEPLRGIEYGSGKYVGKENIDFENIGVYGYGGFAKGQVKKEIQDMTSLIDKSSYDRDMWLQRGIDDDERTARFLGISYSDLAYGSEETLKNLLLGKEITEDGFCSTGAAKGTGFKNNDVILNIYAPAGTKMMYAEPFSKYGFYEKQHGYGSGLDWDGETHMNSFNEELEVLIQRGTSFRITKVEKSDKIYIDVEIIGQNPREI